MTLLEYYQDQIQSGKWATDIAQQPIVIALDNLSHQLTRPKPLFRRTIKGLYIWGSVGRGKTLLMDLFYERLALNKKMRLHFYDFMEQIHAGLKQYEGQVNALLSVAKALSKKAKVICFDEFFVTNIADAMILYNLFRYLVAQGVVLVITSNAEPDELYSNGLQRERFLPAIELIKQSCWILALQGDYDYRQAKPFCGAVYWSPLNEENEDKLATIFAQETQGVIISHSPLKISYRPIPVRASGPHIAWFTFEVLCQTFRSAIDYLEIARLFPMILISGVQCMGEKEEDVAQRFIAMIDEFYDKKIRLIISAQVQPDLLYQGHRLQWEFQRTLSRLIEMQTPEYLTR